MSSIPPYRGGNDRDNSRSYQPARGRGGYRQHSYDRRDSRDRPSERERSDYWQRDNRNYRDYDRPRSSHRPSSSHSRSSDNYHPSSRDRDDYYRGSDDRRRSSIDYTRERDYRDWDRHQRSRDRSRSPVRHRHYEEQQQQQPTKEIRISNLPFGMKNEELRNELSRQCHVDEMLTDVRIVHDQNNASKAFGFLTFADKPSAKKFMDKHYAGIDLGNRRQLATFSYAKERQVKVREPEWRCIFCFSTNFPNRERCRGCDATKTASQAGSILAPADPALLTAPAAPLAPEPQAGNLQNSAAAAEEYAEPFDFPPSSQPDAIKNEPKAKKQKVKSEKESYVPENIAIWKRRQEESLAEDLLAAEKKDNIWQGGCPPKGAKYLSYADRDDDKLICLLCLSQFPSVELLNLHEETSEWHEKNLKDDVLKDFAIYLLECIDRKPAIRKSNGGFWDAAAVQRKQQKREEELSKGLENRYELYKEEEESEAEETVAAPMSKGAALLAKAGGATGWKEGQALGAQGQGIAEPIATKRYAEGAGLGATGQSTEGLTQKEVASQKTKERFMRMLG